MPLGSDQSRCTPPIEVRRGRCSKTRAFWAPAGPAARRYRGWGVPRVKNTSFYGGRWVRSATFSRIGLQEVKNSNLFGGLRSIARDVIDVRGSHCPETRASLPLRWAQRATLSKIVAPGGRNHEHFKHLWGGAACDVNGEPSPWGPKHEHFRLRGHPVHDVNGNRPPRGSKTLVFLSSGGGRERGRTPTCYTPGTCGERREEGSSKAARATAAGSQMRCSPWSARQGIRAERRELVQLVVCRRPARPSCDGHRGS
jgi:hypothetical protein